MVAYSPSRIRGRLSALFSRKIRILSGVQLAGQSLLKIILSHCKIVTAVGVMNRRFLHRQSARGNFGTTPNGFRSCTLNISTYKGKIGLVH